MSSLQTVCGNPKLMYLSEGRMDDETSSSEPLLAAVEGQNVAANGNGFCMDGDCIAEARRMSSSRLYVRQIAHLGAMRCLLMCYVAKGMCNQEYTNL